MSITALLDRNGDGISTARVALDYDFSDAQRESIYTALDTWEALTNVDFSTHIDNPENTVSLTADWIDGIFRIWGYAYYWGEVVFDLEDMNRIEPEIFTTLAIHELGHIVGLGHQSSNSVMVHVIPSAASEPTAIDIANLEDIYGEKLTGIAASVQSGGDGAQEIIGNAGSDILYGNLGADILSARGGADTLYGGQSGDTVVAGAGDDVLYGNKGDDVLSGGAGTDVLYGGEGADTLSGGAGDDVMVGGLGGDLYVVGLGDDTITGFSPVEGDRLHGSATLVFDEVDGAVVVFASGTVKLVGVVSTDLDGVFV